jgi:hypothetical protein
VQAKFAVRALNEFGRWRRFRDVGFAGALSATSASLREFEPGSRIAAHASP